MDIMTNSKFNNSQMKQIRYGLEEDLDVSKYADPKFNCLQMRQIRQGLEHGLDVSQYADPKFNDRQMWEIRLRLIKKTKRTFLKRILMR